MRQRCWAGLLVAVFITAGCSSADTTAPNTETTASTTTALPPAALPSTNAPVSTPEGFEVFDGSADGFTIALPSRWAPVEATGEDWEAILSEMKDSFDPEALEIARTGLAGGFALLALDVTGDPNVNASVYPRGPLDTVESLEALLPSQMEELFGATVLSVDRIEVAGRESRRLVHEIAFPQGEADQHQ